MKISLIFVIIATLPIVLSLIGVFLFLNKIKYAVKSIAVAVYARVYAWSQLGHDQQPFKAITDEKLLLDHPIIAYTNKLVFSYGEKISLHLIGKEKLEVNIFHINRDGVKVEMSNSHYDINTPSVAVYSSFDGIISPSHKVEIDSGALGSGWFGVQVGDSKNATIEIPIFVDPNQIVEKILFVESTDTLLAYNYAYETFKIPNYYNKNLEKSLTGVIPYNAPITYKQVELNRLDEVQRQDHLINSDLIHKLNLGDLGVDFQSISDELLDNPNTLDNINVLIFGSHNEYWTEDKARNVMEFIDGGGKVLLLGGNHAWRQVYREGGRTWLHGSGLTENPIFSNLIWKYIGSYYTVTDYDTYAGIEVIDSKNFLKRFSINVETKSVIGSGTRFPHYDDNILGISGHETDKLTEKSEGFIHLAKGLNENGGADLVYKSFSSGGEVLNFSSIATWHNKDPLIFDLIEKFIKDDD